ncbi:hypothetical protein [Pseudomonas allokribbensis]|uniref:hypothetical protein n=1 Tax=Pseudomonas allokribbensis TaxID=2774460 RepID=UPI0017883B0F|nr:hypothetical protein [Pseudomonas allokribbensis]
MGVKVGRWWVEEGALVAPAKRNSLAEAQAQFPDCTPLAFLAGDGHGNPPFGWTKTEEWWGILEPKVIANQVYCHVEKTQRDVKIDSVPWFFAPVFGHHKVRGWELPISDEILNAMGIFVMNRHLAPARLPKRLVDEMCTVTARVAAAGLLREEDANLQNFRHSLLPTPQTIAGQVIQVHEDYFGNGDCLQPEKGELFMNLCTKYHDAVVGYRTNPHMHRAIAEPLAEVIGLHRDHIHLIAIGYTHLEVNPFYNYLALPEGYFGIADQSSHYPSVGAKPE